MGGESGTEREIVMIMMSRVIFTFAVLAASAASATDYPQTLCDRLAANPEDQDIIAPPVARDQIDLPKAIAACEAELELHPDNVRARYQLSRVLFYTGQIERSNAEMKRAADEGYRQAQFVYGLVTDRLYPDQPAKTCVVEDYWLRSARAGRQAARISYVRHVLNGRFNTCSVHATPAEMQGFIKAAFADSDGYYDRLLIMGLTARLAARALEHTIPPMRAKRASKETSVLAVTDCDRLASHPEDPDIVAPGVPSSKVDLPKAITACTTAVAEDPASGRARYQLARVLAYSGDATRAAAEMKRAADDGYRQAQFVYGLFIDRQRPGAPTDICLAEDYWLKAARNGRQAARVIYVQQVFRGRFDGCRVQASTTEIEQLLDAAAGEAGDFYERILIDELRDRLAERRSP